MSGGACAAAPRAPRGPGAGPVNLASQLRATGPDVAARSTRPATTLPGRADPLVSRYDGARPAAPGAFPLPRDSVIKRARKPAGRSRRAANRMPTGRQPGGRWWKPPGSTTTPEVVDWSRPGPNQMITLNALRAPKAAGRLTLPAIRT
jgi:hypothetical protein